MGAATGWLLLAGAGVLAGLAGSMAGLASLFSYPALLAAGLPATAANVTNTVALTFGTVGSVATTRPELTGQGAQLRRLAPVALLGGTVGAVLLLLTPDGLFESVVPFLVGGASVVLLGQPRIRRRAVRRAAERRYPGPAAGPGALLPGTFAVCVYGGYFGAAAGVLLLALFLITLPVTVQVANAYKNVLLGLANGVASLGFSIIGPVDWGSVPPLAAGLIVGSATGPVLARRVDADLLRLLIGLAGLGLAVRLGVSAWSGG